LFRLILIRHGNALSSGLGGDDFNRSLSDRGKSDLNRLRSLLDSYIHSRATVYCSSSIRTRQTHDCLFGEDDFLVQIIDELYLAPSSKYEHILFNSDELECLIFIGHNPGLSDFSFSFGLDFGDMVTSSAIIIDFELKGDKPDFTRMISSVYLEV
jgi:phosphohistidine phosphatase